MLARITRGKMLLLLCEIQKAWKKVSWGEELRWLGRQDMRKSKACLLIQGNGIYL